MTREQYRKKWTMKWKDDSIRSVFHSLYMRCHTSAAVVVSY